MAMTRSVYVLEAHFTSKRNDFHRLVALICHPGALKRDSGVQMAKDLTSDQPCQPAPSCRRQPLCEKTHTLNRVTRHLAQP